jgi:hypothetical protein
MDKFFRRSGRAGPSLRPIIGGYGPWGAFNTDQAVAAHENIDAPDPHADILRARGLTFARTVTNQSILLLPVDHDRRLMFIINNDAVGNVYISFGAAAAIGLGMKLVAGGGGVLLDFNTPTSEVYAIGDIADNPNVSIVLA